MKKLLAGFLTLITLAWAWDALVLTPQPPGVDPLWQLRQHGIYLTGLWSISLMSLVMVLAIRPAWLDQPMGGMDQVYRLHKYAGIAAIVTGAMHWLLKLSSGILKPLIGTSSRAVKPELFDLLKPLQGIVRDSAEWAIYALLIMLALTLWKRFPYAFWRTIHRLMPALYLLLVSHTIVLMPAAWWTEASGLIQAILLAAGSVASVKIMMSGVGKKQRTQGTILSVEPIAADILEVRCQLKAGWDTHQAGQFAFVTFDKREGAHPFTIASAPNTEGTVTFAIKALGDYTGKLAQTLYVGQTLSVEGPYGQFNHARHSTQAEQIWVAAGIGVTPFIAWLESLQARPEQTPQATLHYCVRDAAQDPFATRLQTLCQRLPSITLEIHSTAAGRNIEPDVLAQASNRPAEVWFCGPAGLADRLRHAFNRSDRRLKAFHQEAFSMR